MRRFKNLRTWFILSALGFLLVTATIPRWYLLGYFLLFMGLVYLNKKINFRKHLQLSPKSAAILFIILSWITGMLLEALLPGVGGMHKKTIPSFILSQGYYWTFPLIMLYLIRKHHYTYWEAFFAAGLANIWESFFILGGVLMTLFSPFFFLSPLVFAMYTTTYAILVGLPLLFIDEKLLWNANPQLISLRKKLLKGLFICGIGSMITFILWLLVMNTTFNNFESFTDILGPSNAANLK